MMITVKDYFAACSPVEITGIFAAVIADLKLYSNNENLTAFDVSELLTAKYGDMYLNGVPTVGGFTRAIDVWHKSRQYQFDKLYQSTLLEYNPIHNVDETENITDTRTPQLTKGLTENSTNTAQYGKTETVTDTITGTNKVTPFDSANFYNDSQSQQSGTTTNTNGGTDTATNTKTQIQTETGTDTNTTARRRTGNIGVTSSQDLIEQERKIANFDLLDIWCERFCERFIVPLYHTEF